MDTTDRLEFIAPSGVAYRAFVAPVEPRVGATCNAAKRSVVFETFAGGWIGAIEVDRAVDFSDIRAQEVLSLLERAARNG